MGNVGALATFLCRCRRQGFPEESRGSGIWVELALKKSLPKPHQFKKLHITDSSIKGDATAVVDMSTHAKLLRRPISQLMRVERQCHKRSVATTHCLRALDAFAHVSDYPPEHPKFIDIPRPVQPQAILTPRVKGILPVPRKLFSHSGPNKLAPEYLSLTTPEPRPYNLEKYTSAKAKDYISYKQRQARKRRQNLRESLQELHQRNERVLRVVSTRSSRNQAMNQDLRTAAEPEDERLTKATVLQADLPQKKLNVSDPNQERNLSMKRHNVAAKSLAKHDEQKDMLHTLYVNSLDFITTGEQLEEAISAAFDNEEQFKSDEALGKNIWNTGEPETTAEMLGKSRYSRDREKAVDNKSKQLVDERLRQIGEELTGGQS